MMPCPGAGATFLPPKAGHIPGPGTCPGTEGRNHSCVWSVGFMPATYLRRVTLSRLRVGVSQAEPETRILTQVDELRATSGIPAGEGGREGGRETRKGRHQCSVPCQASNSVSGHRSTAPLASSLEECGHARQSYPPRRGQQAGVSPTNSLPSIVRRELLPRGIIP